MAVKRMAEIGSLKGLCFCIDPRGCWHGCCLVRRQPNSDRVLLENGAGHIRLARPGEVRVKRMGSGSDSPWACEDAGAGGKGT